MKIHNLKTEYSMITLEKIVLPQIKFKIEQKPCQTFEVNGNEKKLFMNIILIALDIF